MGSLRARLTLAVTAVLVAVLTAAGIVAWRSAVDSQRAAFDERLERTAELSRATALAAVQEEVPTDDRRLDAVLEASQTSLRLLLGTGALLETGVRSPVQTSQPIGVRTITVRNTPWRVLTTTLRDPNLSGLARLEVASSLAPLRARERSLARRLGLIGLVALLVAAGARGLPPTESSPRWRVCAGSPRRLPSTTISPDASPRTSDRARCSRWPRA